MQKSYIFDTSFLVSLLYNDDINHFVALEKLQKLWLDNYFFLNDVILAETITVLTYKHPLHNQSIPLLLQFLDVLHVQQQQTQFRDCLDFYFLLDQQISFQDASLLFDAFRLNAEILTFDKQMLTIYKNSKHLFV